MCVCVREREGERVCGEEHNVVYTHIHTCISKKKMHSNLVTVLTRYKAHIAHKRIFAYKRICLSCHKHSLLSAYCLYAHNTWPRPSALLVIRRSSLISVHSLPVEI